MRVGWVLYGSLEQRTGGTIYDALVVEGLRRAGDHVDVVSLPHDELVSALEAIRPEVVVGDELCFRELAGAFPRLACPRVLLVHHLTAWEPEVDEATRAATRSEEQRAIDACDRIVATSHTTRARLLREGASVPIDVVLPGADRLASCATAARAERATVELVFVGAVTPRKRVLELVRAFATTPPSCTLRLVGSTTRDAAYVAEVEAAIAVHRVGSRVVVEGELDEAGVARAVRGADVLVMPSSLEGYGIAATEAIHAGVPVIASRAEGLEEALASCPDARLFADDEAALASALRRFVTDPRLREAMTTAARAAAPRMPTWSACAGAFRRALSSVAVRGR